MGKKDDDLTDVPESVLKQQREAEKKIREAAEANSTQEPAPVVNTEEPKPEPITEPAPVERPAHVTPAINDGTTDDGQWQHKYSVLQGKYNKEVSDLNGMVVDLKAQMDRQEVVIQGLNSQHSEKAPVNVEIDDLNPEDFQGWGDEMKAMVTTVNKLRSVIIDQNKVIAGLGGKPNPVAAQDDGLQNRVETLESEANNGRISAYLKYLDDNIKGDWRVLNKNAKFIKWLGNVDPISLETRQKALVAAAENLRGSQVTSIFNAYIGANASGTGIRIADELPAGDGSGGGDGLDTAPTLTQADVATAQSDFVKGRITEEEFDKIYSQYQSTLRRSTAR